MGMLVVTSLDGAVPAYRAYRPARVISLLSEEEEIPQFDKLPPDQHLTLYVDQESCAATISAAAKARAREIISFVRAWDGEGDIMIHCKRGVARSPAAAFVVLCMKAPEKNEAEIIADIRKAAPHADPCPLFIEYADAILGRDGRMIDAVEDLSPPCATVSAPTTILQTAL